MNLPPFFPPSWKEPKKFTRSFEDRSKYTPHQGEREKARRLEQNPPPRTLESEWNEVSHE